VNEIAFTAKQFVGMIATVIVTITDIACWDAASCEVTLELIITTCYIHKHTTGMLQRTIFVIRNYPALYITVMKTFARPGL